MVACGIRRRCKGHGPPALLPGALSEPEKVESNKAFVEAKEPPGDPVRQNGGNSRRNHAEFVQITELKNTLTTKHITERREIQMGGPRCGQNFLQPGHKRAFRAQKLLVCQAVGIDKLDEKFTLILVHGVPKLWYSMIDDGRTQASQWAAPWQPKPWPRAILDNAAQLL